MLEPSALLPPVLTPTAPCAAELPLARVAVLEISDEYQVWRRTLERLSTRTRATTMAMAMGFW